LINLKKHRNILHWAIIIVLQCIAQVAVAQVNTAASPVANNVGKDTNLVAKKPKKSSDIKSTVNYQARDSIRFDVSTSIVRLYGEAKITYGEITLTAERITINWADNNVIAEGITDSTGKKIGIPIFTEGADKYVAEQIKYNFKSRKGIINKVVTQQGEGYVHGDKIKKNEDNEIFVDHARYTTCNHSEPHFWIDANKIKLIPNKKFISGPFNLVIAGVRTPLVFPLGYFPLPKKRASGLIIPAYGESQASGFFLQNGGFYWAVNDYIGAKLVGNFWTNGGFLLSPSVDYLSRYKFSGNLNFQYSALKNGIGARQIESQQPPRSIWISWTHNPITKGTGRFSATVNGGSGGFNRNNAITTAQAQSNIFNSTINYNKSFKNTPFSMGIGLRQDQNIGTKVMNFTLPNFTFNMNQIYPFKKIAPNVKALNILNSFNLSYNLNYGARYSNVITERKTLEGFRLKNQIKGDTLTDDADVVRKILNNGNQNISHSLPIGTTFKLLKYFNINPSFNITNNTFFKKRIFEDSLGTNIIKMLDTSGVFNAFNYNTGASATTSLFGILYVRSKKLEAIRTTIRPSASFTYSPKYQGIAYQNIVDSLGIERRLNSFYGLGGSVPNSSFNRVWLFSVQNTIEMKVKKYTDTSMTYKKIVLFDNISASSTLSSNSEFKKRWSNIVLNARTVLLKRLNINSNLILDPYQYRDTIYTSDLKTTKGYNTYKFARFPQKSEANISITTSLNKQAFDRNRKLENKMTPEQVAFYRANPSLQYVDFEIPWNLNMRYNLFWKNDFISKKVGQTAHTFDFDGDLSLTQNWKIVFGTGVDFLKKQISLNATRFSIYRDLHCWQMNMTWNPFNPYATYTFNINVKASSLSDLKVTKRGQGRF